SALRTLQRARSETDSTPTQCPSVSATGAPWTRARARWRAASGSGMPRVRVTSCRLIRSAAVRLNRPLSMVGMARFLRVGQVAKPDRISPGQVWQPDLLQKGRFGTSRLEESNSGANARFPRKSGLFPMDSARHEDCPKRDGVGLLCGSGSVAGL